MRTQYFGDISVAKVLDGTDHFKAAIAFPDVDLNHFHQHHDWIRPFYDFENESIIISTHSYVVKTPEFTAIVDTCIGNDKNRIGSGLSSRPIRVFYRSGTIETVPILII